MAAVASKATGVKAMMARITDSSKRKATKAILRRDSQLTSSMAGRILLTHPRDM